MHAQPGFRCAIRRAVFATLPLSAIAGAVYAAPPGVRHVRADAPVGGDGLTWTTAYNDLRQALIIAGGSGGAVTELWVKEGTYLPGPAGSTDRTVSFRLVTGVGVYGGFAGTETERDERDPAAHLTTLSGNLGGVQVNNVVIGAGGAGTILDGVTVTGGIAAATTIADTGWAGGGVHVTGAPTFRNCIFVSNQTFSTITGTLFRMGGGAYCAPGSAATFSDCTFWLNRTNDAKYGSIANPGKAGAGGGLAADQCAVTLTRCVFRENATGAGGYRICEAGSPGGGANGGDGGGVALLQAAALIQDCQFLLNSTGSAVQPPSCGTLGSTSRDGRDAGNGGAIFALNSSAVILNCAFIDNYTEAGGKGGDTGPLPSGTRGGDGGDGGAIYTVGGPVSIVNCTFARNRAGPGGAGGRYASGTMTGPSGSPGTGAGAFSDIAGRLENCIVWNNADSEIAGNPTIAYSDIRGGYAGPGNIDADPLFIDSIAGDLRLEPGSPCIDAGNSAPTGVTLPATDLDGLPRRVDVASVPNTGLGAPVVDMGAYEVQNPCPIDYTGDGLVDFSDYLEFLNLYDAADARADLTGDGLVDFSDYLQFLDLYDSGC